MTSSILSYIQSHHVATFQMLLPPERLVSDRSPVTDKQQYKYIMWSNWIIPHYYCLHFWAHSMHDRIKPYTITFFPPSLCCGIVYIISHHRECSSSIFKAQWGYKGNHNTFHSASVQLDFMSSYSAQYIPSYVCFTRPFKETPKRRRNAVSITIIPFVLHTTCGHTHTYDYIVWSPSTSTLWAECFFFFVIRGPSTEETRAGK